MDKICVVCGGVYQAKPSSRNVTCGTPACTQTRQREARLGKPHPNAGARARHEARHRKICVVCGQEFACPPSDKTLTCSEGCSSERKKTTHTGLHYQWSEAARERRRQSGAQPDQAKGTAAALRSPIAGPFETHHTAKVWRLLNLDTREVYVAQNLRKWCRDHADLFAPDPWQNAAAGLRQVQRWLNQTAPHKVTRWKNWTLTQAAAKPDAAPAREHPALPSDYWQP